MSRSRVRNRIGSVVATLAMVVLVFPTASTMAAGAAAKRASAKMCSRLRVQLVREYGEYQRYAFYFGLQHQSNLKAPDDKSMTERESDEDLEARYKATAERSRGAFLALYDLMAAVGCDPSTGKPTTSRVPPPVEPVVPDVPSEAATCEVLRATRDRLLADYDVAVNARAHLAQLVAEEALLDELKRAVTPTADMKRFTATIKGAIASRRTEIAEQTREIKATEQGLAAANQALVVAGCDVETGVVASPTAAPPTPTSATTSASATTSTSPKPATKPNAKLFGAGVSKASVTFGTHTVSDPTIKNPWGYIQPVLCPVSWMQVAANGALSDACTRTSREDWDGFDIQPGEAGTVEFENTWKRTVGGSIDLSKGGAVFSVVETRTRRSVTGNDMITIAVRYDAKGSWVRRIDTVAEIDGTATYSYTCQRTGPATPVRVSCPTGSFNGQAPFELSVF